MGRRIIVGITVLLAMLSLGLPGRAQGGEEWGRGFPGRGRFEMGTRLMAMLENDRVKAALGLTDQQTDRLRQIMVERQKSSVKTGAEVALRGIELRELLRADKPDREAVMAKVREISELRGQMMQQHVEALLSTKTVLTPEQQKKIRGFIEGQGREFSRERFRQRLPGPRGRPGAPPVPPSSPPEPPVQ